VSVEVGGADPSIPDVEPQPLPSRALPVAVWEDHLLPLLSCKDASRLGCTCKALRTVVREHFTGIGTIELTDLKSALTTFPEARTLTLQTEYSQDMDVEALMQWLRDGGRGRSLTSITFSSYDDKGLVLEALQHGALPSLKHMDASLELETHRALLTEGLLARMHELQLSITCSGGDGGVKPQLAALGLVRQLPALVKLEVMLSAKGSVPLQWPPFIPPSLKALRIDLREEYGRASGSLLQALPGMFGASGAGLDRLEVLLPEDFKGIGYGLVHVAQALRGCSPTLKGCLFGAFHDMLSEGVPASRVERLRVQWADVLAGVSSCRELEVLVLPYLEVEPLFPPGTAFGRLTHLEISDHTREHQPDAGVMGLWELMASGGLPALAKLSVWIHGRWGGAAEVRTRVAPAFEAVAGTLTHLHLEMTNCDIWSDDEVGVGYELGWRWESCGGCRTSPLACTKMGGFIPPWLRAWPPVGRTPLFLCCGDSTFHQYQRTMPIWWRALFSRVCGSLAHPSRTFKGPS
jgi:hypothetical protein